MNSTHPTHGTLLHLKTLISKFAILLLLSNISGIILAEPVQATSSKTSNHHNYSVINGVLDLSSWDFDRDGKRTLSGAWVMIWDQLIPPEDVQAAYSGARQEQAFYPVPQTWDASPETAKEGLFHGHGSATYIVKVVGLNADSKNYALVVPYIANSHEIFLIQESLPKGYVSLTKKGVPALTADQSHAQASGDYAANLPKDLDRTFYLAIHVANFAYARGGLYRALTIGESKSMHFKPQLNLLINIFCMGIIFVIMLNSLSIYNNAKEAIGNLFLALICGVVMLRVVATQYLIEDFSGLPSDLNFLINTKLQYLSMTGALGPMASYCYHLFPKRFSKKIVNLIWVVSLAHMAIVFFTSTTTLSYYITHTEAIIITAGLYILGATFLAIINKDQYSVLFGLSMTPFFIAILHDIFEANNLGIGIYITQYAFVFVLYILGVIMRNKAHNKSMQAQRKIIEAETESKAKSQFLATMSHEIRTPMNGVLGMTELLEDMHLEARARSYVSIIAASGRSLLTLIDDILDFSKLDAGKMEIEPQVVDLNELIFECLSVFSLNAEKKGLLFQADIDMNLPSKITSDPVRLRQVIINLMGNALKFTESGSITLNIKKLDEQTSDQPGQIDIIFEVKDTGIGISEQNQKKLFHTFIQEDSSTSRLFGGTGLGLSISKKLCALMGGEIGVDSVKGIGSTFWFTIQANFESSTPTITENANPLLKNKRVLVVNDSSLTSSWIMTYSSALGMDCNKCRNLSYAQEYLNAAESNKTYYDFILINIRLISDSINNNLQMFLSENTRRHSKIILVTGLLDQIDEEDMASAGITHTLQLPTSISYMQQVFVNTLESQNAVISSSKRISAISTESSDYSGKRILVVEDNDVNQAVITGMLEKMGVNPLCVADGLLALQAVHHADTPFDLILMDCELPTMDGYETTIKIRAFEETLNIHTPIVALTANIGKSIREKCMDCGMDNYLSKPMEYKAVESILDLYLS